MCGFAGLWSPNDGIQQLRRQTAVMCHALNHRGPDDSGLWADDAAGLVLGHRRLAILDLSSAGHQPMLSQSGRFSLVFNGEIYNHLELRADLQRVGAAPSWRGHSDTETLLASIEAWGLAETLRRSHGMFSLASWDQQSRTLSLARDRAGEKPLYYGWLGAGGASTFAFASELKALTAHHAFDNKIDRDALSLFLQLSYVPSPHSIYENIRKLTPGHILTLPGPGMADTRTSFAFWRFADVAAAGCQSVYLNEAEAISALHAALETAVSKQMIADVPLGAFLSGGIDSSTIVALMQQQASQPVQTFTVGFDEAGFDESVYAKAVARHLGTNHHEIRVTPADALDVVPLLPSIYDEPFGDSSQIPTYLICKAARQEVTVALSGDAGDELFGGYNRYLWSSRILRKVKRIPKPFRSAGFAAIAAIPAPIWNRFGQWLPGALKTKHFGEKAHGVARRLSGAESNREFYDKIVSAWPGEDEIVRGIKVTIPELDDRGFPTSEPAEQRMMLWDSVSYLRDDILTKIDRAAMSVSLETRVPFLDPDVVELAWRLPLHMKVRGGQGKWALRRVLERYVPTTLIDRPKAGFSIPLASWLRGPLRDWAEELIAERRLADEGYLHAPLVRRIWLEHLRGDRDWSARIWNVLMFQAWLERQRGRLRVGATT